jgi:hypothetical protein
VEIFSKNAVGNWIQFDILTPFGEKELFGSSVSIYEDVIAVGAPGTNSFTGNVIEF